MDKIKRDGFEFWVNLDGEEYLILSSYNFEEALDYAQEKRIKNLDLNFCNDLDIEDLDFFNRYDFFEKVEITFDRPINLEGMYFLTNLKGIALCDEINNAVDLSKFPKLEQCWLFWSKYQNLSKCKNIKKLTLHKLGESDLQSLSKLVHLEELEVVNSRKLLSLNGAQMFKKLNVFRLFILPKLTDFSALNQLNKIKYFHIETCKRLKNLDWVKYYNALEVLNINECKEIDSLKNLIGLNKLQEVWIRNTKILDADLSPLIARKMVYCSNYKGHSHTWQQLRELQKL